MNYLERIKEALECNDDDAAYERTVMAITASEIDTPPPRSVASVASPHIRALELADQQANRDRQAVALEHQNDHDRDMCHLRLRIHSKCCNTVLAAWCMFLVSGLIWVL